MKEFAPQAGDCFLLQLARIDKRGKAISDTVASLASVTCPLIQNYECSFVRSYEIFYTVVHSCKWLWGLPGCSLHRHGIKI